MTIFMKMAGLASPLFNFEIDCFLSKYKLPEYLGVFSSNNIPETPNNFILICNLSNKEEKGSHFITICKINSELFILDSLALNIGNANLSEFISNLEYDKINTIKDPIQSFQSISCGLFCVYFVLLFHVKSKQKLKIPLYRFVKNNLILNDGICIDNINLLTKYIQLQ